MREIRRRTRRQFAPEEKIRVVLEGLRGEQSISELCRREGIAPTPIPILWHACPRVAEPIRAARRCSPGADRVRRLLEGFT